MGLKVFGLSPISHKIAGHSAHTRLFSSNMKAFVVGATVVSAASQPPLMLPTSMPRSVDLVQKGNITLTSCSSGVQWDYGKGECQSHGYYYTNNGCCESCGTNPCAKGCAFTGIECHPCPQFCDRCYANHAGADC